MKNIVCWGGLLLISTQAMAADMACSKIAGDSERLACYDQSNKLPVIVADLPQVTAADKAAAETAQKAEYEKIQLERLGSGMVDRWELDPNKSTGVFLPKVYKPTYILPITYTSSVNRAQSLPAANFDPANAPQLSAAEAKFQISLKAKVWEHPMGLDANLWAGYTQSSRWQIYSPDLSRPFRETNYEPEVMMVFHTPYEIFGWQGRIASLSLNHQSNGRALPLSRSWNRIIGEIGVEREDWSLSLRPWWRIKEKIGNDDNPDIENYAGRGEVLLTHTMQRHVFTLQARHSLRSGANSRGSMQLDWAFPLGTGVHGYLQLFSGYGESLIDYNFKQTKLGLGISLVEWR